ncbi:MAG: chemotaxis protein CheX [Nitrospinaceae bacterium]|jgi:chemotaxis protein CheX|nr:chemotaxis protein CheX [Nitrospinaceae bacterium]MBT3434957.1 chemotaxis protein CheX [Nitrospinaceae bacterium]MBT3821092.1 chemotaxis protein CheX [Nitrospinaceae bacterium]MBT4094002.1 chemotaxis protein CheX [Nitrospinaceae bacterium]MBT4430198.1 chemotaxis protein CheX [Nitrospinaceae bacterium]
MKAEFLNPFLQATVNVLSTMAMLSPKPGKPQIKETDVAVGDITGIIGLTGYSEGSLAVSFSESCALKIVENMIGEQFSEMNEDVADAVGELTNMISGDARSQLQKLGFDFTAAIPTVVRGKDHTIRHVSASGTTLMIPFSTEHGNFYIEASFAS